MVLLLLNHDPSAVRLSAASDEAQEGAGGTWGGARPDGRALVGRLLALLGCGRDEGVLVQASEVCRILLDTSGMEPTEQNGFLDHIYGAGYMARLVSALHTRASEALTEVLCAPPAAQQGLAVFSVESLLEVLTSTFGQHGYRSVRLMAEPVVWEALRNLLRGRRGSLRASTTRAVRILVQAMPACAARVHEAGLITPMLQQLLRHGNPRADGLGNSAVLALLDTICEGAELGLLRSHLAGAHRPQLEIIAAANPESHPARVLLAIADAADAAAEPTATRLANMLTPADAPVVGPADRCAVELHAVAAADTEAVPAPDGASLSLSGNLRDIGQSDVGLREMAVSTSELSASEERSVSGVREVSVSIDCASSAEVLDTGEEENLPPGAFESSHSNSPNSPRPASPSKPAALFGGKAGSPVSGLACAFGAGRPLTMR